MQQDVGEVALEFELGVDEFEVVKLIYERRQGLDQIFSVQRAMDVHLHFEGFGQFMQRETARGGRVDTGALGASSAPFWLTMSSVAVTSRS